jgi:hypothetical protein
MKKKLEADLISIAHRILQLKNKSDINQLYLETQKLYEKLSVLRFVDEHFSDAKPTIGITEIERKIEEVFDQKETKQPETIAEQTEETISEETIETPLEEKEEIVAEEEAAIEEEIIAPETAPFIPSFELSEEDEVEEDEVEVEEEVAEIETPKKMEAVQISFEDLLGGNYSDAQFVKVHPLENIPTAIAIDFEEKQLDTIEEVKPEPAEPKTASLNEKLAKNINIDLNDRIAFTKHLFGNSSEDYNRVLNQLITFDTFYETRDFIQEMVKPDYNNWEGKQDYEERFMDIIEKKFL